MGETLLSTRDWNLHLEPDFPAPEINNLKLHWPDTAMLASLLCFAVFISLAFYQQYQPPVPADKPSLSIQLQRPEPKPVKTKAVPPPASPTPAKNKPAKQQAKPVRQKPKQVAVQTAAKSPATVLDLSIPIEQLRIEPKQTGNVFNSQLQQQLDSPQIQRLNQAPRKKAAVVKSYRHVSGDEIVQVGDTCGRVVDNGPDNKMWVVSRCTGKSSQLFKNWKNGEKLYDDKASRLN